MGNFCDNFVKRCRQVLEYWKKQYLLIFIGGILLYFPFSTHFLTNPDTLWNGLFYKSGEGYGWEASLGRWGLKLFAGLKGYTISPAAVTFFCILLLSIVCMLICMLFNFKGAIQILLVSVFLLASPNFANTLSYYYCADFYAFAYFLNVLSICIAYKYKGFCSWIIPIFSIALSLALYQAYISVAIVVSLMLIIHMLFDDKNNLQILKKGLKLMCVGGGGIAIYLLITKLWVRSGNLELTDGRGFSEMGNIDFKTLPVQFLNCYREFFNYFFSNDFLNNEWMYRKYWNILLFLLLAIFCMILLWQKRKIFNIVRLLFLILTVVLLPVGCYIILIIAPKVSLYESTGMLLVPALNYIYILWLLLAWKIDSRKIMFVIRNCIIPVGGILIGGILIQFVLVFQSCMQNNQIKTYAVAAEIVNEIDSITDGENDILPILICGDIRLGNEELYNIVQGTVAKYGMVWSDFNGRKNCWDAIFRIYFGREYNMYSGEEYEKIISSEAYQSMPAYPRDGWVGCVEDCIVVKLNEI